MNQKYIKLMIGNAVFAAAVIVLYSPGLIGLSLFSDSALKTALSAAIGVILIPSFIVMNKALLAEKELNLLNKNDGNQEEKIKEVMNSCRSSKILGSIAKTTLAQMQRLKTSEANFDKLVSQRFERGSLSYQKFMGAAESASRALFHGYVRISNKLVIFDEDEYEKLNGDEYLHDDIPDDIQRQKLTLYEENLNSARKILEENELILLEIEKLMTEISNTDYSDNDMNTTLAEIDGLLHQLEYYKVTVQ